jgi:hypothetical protein
MGYGLVYGASIHLRLRPGKSPGPPTAQKCAPERDFSDGISGGHISCKLSRSKCPMMARTGSYGAFVVLGMLVNVFLFANNFVFTHEQVPRQTAPGSWASDTRSTT